MPNHHPVHMKKGLDQYLDKIFVPGAGGARLSCIAPAD